jgi:hypothetical protein
MNNGEVKEVSTSFVLNEEILAWLRAEAKRQDRTVSSLVRGILTTWRKVIEEGWVVNPKEVVIK